jgi:4-amino-4-deoxy-L-arabinose transferase-like glycosyltransferase
VSSRQATQPLAPPLLARRPRTGLWAAVRKAVRAVPTAAWACALVALANGLAWSLIVPPFEVPDENAHYAYVVHLAETGNLPRPAIPVRPLPPRQEYLMNALLTFGMVGDRENPAPLTDGQQKSIESVEAEKLPATAPGDALSATNNPPAYYFLEAAVYKLMPSGRVLDKLAAMRVLSALMGAITVLLVFMFLRDLLPTRSWAWTTGALVVAFQPLFGFISGGVNNDNLLYLAGAGTLWGVARSFRGGLTPANGALLGGFLGLGLVSKLTMLGFVPAVALALALLLVRDLPRKDSIALRGAGIALVLAAAPLVAYLLLNHFVWGRAFIPGGVGGVSTPAASTRHFSTTEEISHVWQLFLPHLWVRPQFNSYPLWTTWFIGFIGRFGWQDYTFPYWVYQVARVVVLAALALACVELVRRRLALRRRLAELSVYVVAVLGLCVEIGIQSYRYFVVNGLIFEQARYLLPLLGLYGAIGALAARSVGRRWGPALGAALVVLAIGHDLYAQAITIARYYS